MRIAITTWYGGVNPGTLFQLYGLYSFLKERGHEVSVVKYIPSSSDFLSKGVFYYLSQARMLVRKKMKAREESKLLNIYCQPFKKQLEEREKSFDVFYSKIKFTNPVRTDEDFRKLNGSFDIFIVGSDQVWNSSMLNRRYLLDYVSPDKVKAAFGPSIGTNLILPKQVNYFRHYLKDFKYIAVREKRLKQLLSEDLHIPAEHLLDPSMLISKTQYIQMARVPNYLPKEDYLLCYFTPSSQETETEIRNFAKSRGLKIVVAAMQSYQYQMDDVIIETPGPREWLGLIANASVVMTSSFHCTLFSILFHRDLYVIENKRLGKSDDISLRYREQLETFGIIHRLVRAGEHIDSLHQKNIDYEKVQQILDERLEKSRLFFNQFC